MSSTTLADLQPRKLIKLYPDVFKQVI